MERVDQNDQRDQHENCEQDPQPQQGCGLTNQRKGCEGECVGNCLGPARELHVFCHACGITRACEQCAVEQLHGQECGGLHLVGDRGILGQNECVGQRLGSVCIYRGRNQRADVGDACQIFTLSDVEEELYRAAVGLRLAGNAVDGVIKGLYRVGNVDVNHRRGHGECAVGQRYVVAVCILYRNGSGVADLIGCADGDGRSGRCGACRDGYVRSCNDRVGHIHVGCGDGYNTGRLVDRLVCCVPSTNLGCYCGNFGNNVLGLIVFCGNTLNRADGDTVCNEVDGVGFEIPLCEEVQILNTQLGGKACPYTALAVSFGSEIGNCRGKLSLGIRIGQEILNFLNLCSGIGNCQVLKTIFYTTAIENTINIEVNVIDPTRQRNGHFDVRVDHRKGVAVAVGLIAVCDTVRYDLIACGNCKAEFECCTCRIVLNNHLTNLLAGFLKHVGDGILGGYHELGEVLCVEGNILTVCRLNTIIKQYSVAIFDGVNVGFRVFLLCKRNLNCNRCALEIRDHSVAVYDREIVGCNTGHIIAEQLTKSGFCGIGGLINERDLIGCRFVGLCTHQSQNCVVKCYEREILRIVLDCNVKTNVCFRNCTGKNIGIYVIGANKIQHEAFGKLAQNSQRVNAVLLGKLVCKVCICKAKIVSGRKAELEGGILGDLGGLDVDLFRAHQPTDGVRTVEVRIFGLGRVDQSLDLCKSLCIVCKSCAVVNHEVTEHLVIFVNEGHLVHVQICINGYVVVGHGLELYAVGGCPARKLVARKRGVVLVYVQVGSDRQERGEKHLAAVTGDEFDLTNILNVDRNVNVHGNAVARKTADQQFYGIFYRGNAYLGEYAVDCFFKDRLGVVGKVARFRKYAVSVVDIRKACVLQLNGKQIELGNEGVLYLIILRLILGCLVDCLIVQLVRAVGVENVERVFADLPGNDLCDLIDHGNVLASIENFLNGNVTYVDSKLALYCREECVDDRDLLCLVNVTVCLYRQGLEICVYVASRACLNCGAYAFDRLIGSLFENELNHFVQILLGDVCAKLVKASLYKALCLYSLVQRGRLDRIKNCDHVFKGELLVEQIDRSVSTRGGHSHDRFAKLGCECVKVEQLGVNNGRLGGNGELHHDRFGRDLKGIGIDYLIKSRLQLGCRIADGVEIACQNELELDLLVLVLRRAVDRVAQLDRGGEDHVIFKGDKVVQFGNKILNCHDQLLGVDLKQLVAFSLCRNGVAVDLDQIDVLEQLVSEQRGNVGCHALEVD